MSYLLSFGINPEDIVIYRQSDVLNHTFLYWILGTLTKTNDLSRMTQYKSKSEQWSTTHGLFSYPVLMAADILLFRADSNIEREYYRSTCWK